MSHPHLFISGAAGKVALVPYLLYLARRHAACRQVHPDDIEDCAIEFVLHMLQNEGRALRPDSQGVCSTAWLHRCADNYAQNFRLKLTRRQARTQPLEGLGKYGDSGGEQSAPKDVYGNIPDCIPTPEEYLLRGELRQHVAAALADLQPLPRYLFLRHCLDVETLQALAQEIGKTPDAVRMIIARVRKQLQQRLCRQGMTEADLRGLLPRSGRLAQHAVPHQSSTAE